jgi:hypothetical protein
VLIRLVESLGQLLAQTNGAQRPVLQKQIAKALSMSVVGHGAEQLDSALQVCI